MPNPMGDPSNEWWEQREAQARGYASVSAMEAAEAEAEVRAEALGEPPQGYQVSGFTDKHRDRVAAMIAFNRWQIKDAGGLEEAHDQWLDAATTGKDLDLDSTALRAALTEIERLRKALREQEDALTEKEDEG
jgi:hypothetical protein